VTPEPTVSSEPTWDFNDLLLFVFLAMLSVGLAQVISYLAVHALHLPEKERALAIMPSQLLLYALLFAALYAILKLQYGRTFWPSLAWVNYSLSAFTVVTLGFLLAFAIGGSARLLHTPEVDTPMRHLLERRVTLIEFGLVGTTVGPLCEELVFRGFMQPVFVRSLGPVLGILITAMLFGSLHLAQNGFAWQSGVLITLAGMAFGWMRHVTGSTKASTLMHSAYNFLYFLAVIK
jgi:membrane protease YdiL (CAAX protease family)